MGNIDTVKAITTNIEAILIAAPLSWSLEDLSDDRFAETTNACFVQYDGETFEDVYKQRPSYNEAEFTIVVAANRTTPAAMRSAQQEIIHLLNNAFSVNALNVGDLSASLLVDLVEHSGAQVLKEGLPVVSVIYRLKIRYRET